MLKIGEFCYDTASRDLIGKTSSRRLSAKAAEVLAMLCEAGGRVCLRADLLDHVWARVTVGEEVLTHAIAELRRAFSDDRRAPRYIETVHKSGYRLKAEVAPASGRPGMSAPFNLEAYCHALEAQAHLERGGRRNTAMAVDLYSLAVECDPHSPIGHAGLAKALVFSCAYYGPDRSKLMRAETHCSAALRAEPGSAEALAALGFLTAVRGDHRGGCERFIQSLARAPQSSETHYLIGRSCLVAGEYRAAAAILERAASLRDDDYQSLAFAGKMRLKLGEEASARANFVRGLRRAEAFLQSWPDSYRAVRCLADCLWHLGRKAEAVALLDRMLNHDDPMPYYNASFLALAGETDVALETLSDAVDEGWRHAAFLAHDQDFDSLRGEIRFRRIARTAGAEA